MILRLLTLACLLTVSAPVKSKEYQKRLEVARLKKQEEKDAKNHERNENHEKGSHKPEEHSKEHGKAASVSPKKPILNAKQNMPAPAVKTAETPAPQANTMSNEGEQSQIDNAKTQLAQINADNQARQAKMAELLA